MTRHIATTAATVLELYGEFNFAAYPACVALSDTRFIVAAQYNDAPAPYDGTIGVWLLDNNATILDHTRIPASHNAILPCGPMRTNSSFAVLAIDATTGLATVDRSIVGLDLSGDTITTTYQTTPAGTTASYGSDAWISTTGKFCIAQFAGPHAIPTTQDVYDPATGAHLGTAAYAPNKTPLPIDQINIVDFPAEPSGEDTRSYYTITLPPYGVGSAAADTFFGTDESKYLPVGYGCGGVLFGGGSGQGYVGINYPNGRGILCGIEFYSISGLIAAIVPGTVTPPLRQRQRSDGLAASGAPRQHQRATLQVSNRQRAIR